MVDSKYKLIKKIWKDSSYSSKTFLKPKILQEKYNFLLWLNLSPFKVILPKILKYDFILNEKGFIYEHQGTIGVLVLKKYWRQGVARDLILKLMDRNKTLKAYVEIENKKSIHFFKKMGFTPKGIKWEWNKNKNI